MIVLMQQTVNKRIFSIDVLRGIAVILVLFRHFHSPDYKIYIPILEKIGWLGVDLFFVLSGFLISSLLYAEIEKNGNINFKKFFIRRGFKIYPSFYFFILFTILTKIILHKEIILSKLLSELFFMQSYIEGMVVHSWSLSIEEHFYILLPLLLIFFVKYYKINIKKTKLITLTFVIFAFICLSIRIYNVNTQPFNLFRNVFNTHIRIDSLLFGVFISYHYRYNNERLKKITIKYLPLFILYCIVIFPLAFFYDLLSNFVMTFGFTLFYMGFGMILLMVLFINDIFTTSQSNKNKIHFVLNPISYIGFYSYTIYLWHIVAEGIISRNNWYYKWNIILSFSVYILISVLLGVATSKLIEQPALKLRNKYF